MSHVTNETHVAYANNDARLKPRERKHPLLWQAYLVHQELTEMRKRHVLRLKSIESGKSNLDADYEKDIIERFELDAHVKPRNKGEYVVGYAFYEMVGQAQTVGPIWDWLISHKGIAESLAAKLLALIDDIEKFETISHLWRHAGYGLYMYWQDEKGKLVCPRDGWRWEENSKGRYRVWTVCAPKSEWGDYKVPPGNEIAIPQNTNKTLFEKVNFIEPKPEWELVKHRDFRCASYHSPYSGPLKSLIWNISDGFIKQRTPIYRKLYDVEKARQLAKYPEKVKENGKTKFNPGHLHARAQRKVNKEFLKQLWLTWRKFEGLPISKEY